MFKDLLVNLSIGAKTDTAAAFAVDVAAAFEAHATGVAFAYEPVIPATVMGGVPTDFIEAQIAESERAANKAKEHFDRLAQLASIVSDSHMFTASLGGAADQFSRMARRFSLAVVMQAQEEGLAADGLIAEAAMFGSGGPVIVVPYIHKAGLKTDTIMVCWDGGRASARAINDSLPLLARARQVEVVIVAGEEGKRDTVPGADMGQHLARYGLKVEVKRIVADGDIPNTLLSHAADISADMIVMGGYGHSRLREFILGGVTRTMLESMTVPCLISH